MYSKRTKPTSLALLPFIQPTITTTAALFPLQTRHLQIRANVLLLSKKPFTASTLPTTTQTFSITPQTSLKILSNFTLQLDKYRLTFRTQQQLLNFQDAVLAARQSRARYETVSQIGSGASGVVYLVRRHDGNLFAMKTIPKYDAFYSDNHLSRIISERLALAQAKQSQTPFIVSLIDAFETNTHLCLVTELASLGDLHTFITQTPRKRLPESTARRLFAEALLGLEDLHKMGYLYRDMKLNNLLLTKTGHVRLADFGLAKRLATQVVEISNSSSSSSESESEEEEEVRLVGRTNSFVGTRRYMSPEHLVSGRTSNKGYGAPADVWALGVVLYVMLTGRYPFGNGVSSGNAAGLFLAIKHDDLVFPEYLSEDVKNLLGGMLDRDWLERFDINQTKSHAWVRGVDWAGVRQSASADEVVEDVIRFGGESIEERVEGLTAMEISDVSDEDGSSGKRKSEASQLLGFGFMGSRTIAETVW